jgi:hypothetical protein
MVFAKNAAEINRTSHCRVDKAYRTPYNVVATVHDHPLQDEACFNDIPPRAIIIGRTG